MTGAIVLTGASGGLGRALAARLAAPGHALLLLGRDGARLSAAADLARDAGATVETAAIPVEDAAGMTEALRAFDDRHPVTTVVANAGVKTGNTLGVEPPGGASRIIGVNLIGAANTVEPLLPRMTDRGAGQIGLIASLAGMQPQPDLLSYSASKAGLRAYGTGLRRALRGTGVGVSVISPGFVDTPMTTRHHGPTPLRLRPNDAADRIARALAARRPYCAFPWPLVLGARLNAMLPVRWGDWIDGHFRARIEPDDDEARGPGP